MIVWGVIWQFMWKSASRDLEKHNKKKTFRTMLCHHGKSLLLTRNRNCHTHHTNIFFLHFITKKSLHIFDEYKEKSFFRTKTFDSVALMRVAETHWFLIIFFILSLHLLNRFFLSFSTCSCHTRKHFSAVKSF